jgi:hypothetical protein
VIDFKNRKVLLSTGLGFICLISIIYLISTTNPSPSNKTSLPVIQSPVNGELLIESDLTENSIKIPTTLPVYQLEPSQLSPTEISSIAINFGFSTQPLKFKDVNIGEVYFWSEGDNTLRISPIQNFIEFKKTFPVNQTGTFSSPVALQNTAEKFLSDKIITGSNSFNFDSVRYLKYLTESAGETTPDKADVADIKFIQNIDSYPILNLSTSVGTIDIQIARNNDIVLAYLDLAPKMSGQEVVSVKSFTELVSQIKQSKLVSLDKGKIDLLTISNSMIKKITITSASLGYLKQSNLTSQVLQPIFIMEANAQLTNGLSVPAQLYLPAAK